MNSFYLANGSNVKPSRWIALHTTALVLLLASSVGAQTLPHNIPDFSNDATRTTRRSVTSGNWSNAATWSGGVVPTANQVVHIDPGHVVTIDNTAAVGYTIAVHGTLRFSRSANSRLTVTTLMVMGDHGMPSMSTVGYLDVGTTASPIPAGVTAEIIIRNAATGSGVADPEQFGTGLINMGKVTMHGAQKTPTWLRVGAEPLAGHTTLTLESPLSGWQVGDRVVLPDTRHIRFDEVSGGGWVNAVNQWEERTISAINGATITLNAALTYSHRGSRNFAGVLEYLPHVGNLTRNVVVKSESATGTRGHTISVHNSDTDIRFVTFRDLGRTTFKPLNTTTNLIGRYPLHMHHNRGPLPTPANGYQFTLIGNAVDGGSAATQFKWGIAIHNSHYGLIQDNVVYNYNGSSIATEDGSESFNVFDHNFALRGMGEPDNSVSQARTAMGTEGVGFWFRGANNYVRNNVASNFQNETVEAAYGFVYQLRMLGNVLVPNFKGADPAVSGEFTTRNGNNMPILQFENNEVYGAMQGGFTLWWIGSQDPTPYSNAQESVIKNLTVWNTYNKSVYMYPSARITFDGLKIRGEYSSNSRCCGNGVHFSDYSASEIIIRNSDIQGVNSGIDAPSSGLLAPKPNLTVENTTLRNWSNLNVPTPSSVNGCWMQDKLVVARNVTFLAPPGRSLKAISMGRAIGGAIECLSKKDEVRVYRLDGDSAVNFQLYHPDSSVIPRPPAGCTTTRAGFSGTVCTIAGEGTLPTVPTVTLSASPASITAGQSSTLSWTSTNATSVSINQGIGSVTPVASGTRSVSPATTTTYTITAVGASGSATATATVAVTAPPTVTFSASPQTIGAGQSSTLSWTTTNATSATINQGIGTVTPVASGTRTVSPAATTTYTITVTGPGGSTTATATVTVTSAPTVTFGASPQTIGAGQSSTLSWTTTNATSATINQGIGTVTPVASGTRTVSPAATTTYTITVTGPGGSTTATATVTVTPAPTVTFGASPQTIGAGQSSTLSWTTTNATSVSIDQGIGSVTPVASGTFPVSPGATTTYTITVTGPGGSTTATATVTVTTAPGPTITFGASPLTIEPGQSSTLSWTTTNATSVSIDQGIGSVTPVASGTSTVSPGATTAYTITVTGPGGTTNASVTVEVLPAHANILWRHSSGTNYLWLMDGTERIGEGPLAPLDPLWQAAGTGDYNGDGHADILWRHSTGANYLWLMNGTERIGEGQLAALDPLWQVVGSGDYNGDGHADILWRHSSGTNYLWLMDGTERIGEGQLASLDPTWRVVGAADYDGDGRADILWRNSFGAHNLWLMNGTQRIGGGQLAAFDPAWQVVAAADYNGDGRADILWRNSSGSNYLWLMNGTQRIGGGAVPRTGQNWQVVGARDYNGDGQADILWRHSSGMNSLWLMNGTERIGGGRLPTLDPAWKVVYTR